MIVLVQGVGFHNQGAALMLRAVIERFANRDGVELAVEPFAPYSQRAPLGLLQMLPQWRLGRSSLSSLLMPRDFRRRYGLVRCSEIDGVLDASGFVYSDSWGVAPTEIVARRARIRASRGVSTVILPQAMGPFTGSPIRSAFKQMMSCVELAYARDSTSLEHARGVCGGDHDVRQSPDFTLTISPKPEDLARFAFDGVTVVPNVRMLDKTDAETSSRYVHTLRGMITKLLAAGVNARVLAHGTADMEVACALASGTEGVRVVQERCPLAWKAIVVASRVVVASRYHALVSALASGVPAVGIGWSHKYEALFEEYGLTEYCLAGDETSAEVARVVLSLMEGQEADRVQCLARAHAAEVRIEVESMWGAVEKVLGIHGDDATMSARI